MNRIFYTVEQFSFELSGLEAEHMHFRLGREHITENMTAILREIEKLPEFYWNASPIELIEARDDCLATIEETVEFLYDHWRSLRWYHNNRPTEARRLFLSAYNLLIENFECYNRLALTQHCLLPHRRYIAQRRG